MAVSRLLRTSVLRSKLTLKNLEVGSHSGISWVGCRYFSPNQTVICVFTGYYIWMTDQMMYVL